MTAHRACRTARTARCAGLVAVAAAAALSLTACQSGGKDAAAGSGKKVSVSASASTGDGGGLSGAKAGEDRAKASGDRARTGMQTQTTAVHRTTSPATAPKTTSPVRTQTLPDGSKAEIYKVGGQHYFLKIVHRGDVLGTMDANHRAAGLDANDMFIVLTQDGRVQSWMGGGHQGPGTFKLMGGWTTKVTKVGEDHCRARILGDAGGVSATLDANGHDAGVELDRVYIVLSAGGVISAHA
ncbi:hypothetical protein A6P39_004185 [Streptomyces sp. FXJ1.172]|uniref:hypothetical protein n=1 Tax=Streptomyces sp. FXJ1.172 TaxID=710705 RepID=UPI0007CFD371|nr:hypothetical protein [Streptomyces sp. FXJ1.172]WEO93294.1 hypothetical protein A6P39_004185 [Streptomyces sp. FXJ1.172]